MAQSYPVQPETVTVTAAGTVLPRENPDLALAIRQIQQRRAGYDLYRRYYRGDQRIVFATYRWDAQFTDLFRNLADNVCSAIVHTLADKLEITGFKLRQGAAGQVGGVIAGADTDGDGDADADLSAEIWSRNRMDARFSEIGIEASRSGDAYAIVGNDDQGRAVIFPQRGEQMTVHYSSEVPGLILWAAKVWTTSDYRVRLNMYYPDRIEHYITANPLSQVAIAPLETTQAIPVLPSGFQPYEAVQPDGTFIPAVIENPWGRVLVFHFPMGASIGEYGISELHNVIPIQDMLNKSLANMSVTGDFASYPQRWAAGVEVDVDPETGEALETGFKPGVDRVWLSASELTKFGQFDAADMSQFIAEQQELRMEACRIACRPLHVMGLADASSNLSGETVNNLSRPFTAKVRRTHTVFGVVAADMMAFCVQMERTLAGGVDVPEDPAEFYPLPDFETQWVQAETVSDKEAAEVASLWLSLGIPLQYVLTRRLGMSAEEAEEIAAAKAEAEAAAAAQAHAQAVELQSIKGAVAPGQDQFAPTVAARNL